MMKRLMWVSWICASAVFTLVVICALFASIMAARQGPHAVPVSFLMTGIFVAFGVTAWREVERLAHILKISDDEK